MHRTRVLTSARGALALLLLAGGGAIAKGTSVAERDDGELRTFLGDDGITWTTFVAMETAVAEARQRGVKLEECRIQVMRWGKGLAVMFLNRPQQAGSQGCPPGPCECFDVELSPDGKKVLSAQYAR